MVVTISEVVDDPSSSSVVNDADTLRTRGNVCFAKGDDEGAIALYTEALSLTADDDDSTTSKLYSNRAAANLRLTRHSEAIVDCRKSLLHDPLNIKAAFRRAQAQLALRQYDATFVNDLQLVLVAQADNKEARSMLGIARDVDPSLAFDHIPIQPKSNPVGNNLAMRHVTVPMMTEAVTRAPAAEATTPHTVAAAEATTPHTVDLADQGKSTQKDNASSSAPTVDDGRERTLPPVPSTAFMFGHTYRTMAADGRAALLLPYLMSVPAVKCAKLVDGCWEGDMLSQLIASIDAMREIAEVDEVGRRMELIFKLPRVATDLIFITDEEKAILHSKVISKLGDPSLCSAIQSLLG